jgi:hypothetical protein
MELRTEPVFDALKSLLGVIESDDRRKQVEDYIDTAHANVDRALFDVFAHLADGVNDKVAAHYELSLNYRPGVLDLDVREREASEPEPETWSVAEGDVEKVTLRIPAELKDLATDAASKSGLSLNSWFLRMMARSLRNNSEGSTPEPERWRHGHRRGERHSVGKRLSGWVGPEN